MSKTEPLRIGIMLSGTGSTYAFIQEAIDSGQLQAQVCAVVSSKANAGGVAKAQQFNHLVKVVAINSPEHHKEIADFFRTQKVDLVVMAGWLHLWQLPKDFLEKTINVHPSLIPAFSGPGMYGMKVHQAVIDRRVRFSGCTVHLVDDQYDHGRILDQRVVPVEYSDSPQTLAAKVQQTEKSLLVNVIAQWACHSKTPSP